ncbi:hypothetical protein B0J11DRAFT_95321 [Dendryphion nanum]|uniref:Uncharacterized protein n=1 Tax=Dendryphion nanum TaxID=256645 RepID=A0A9P9DFC9_9PLEO|nr:hypothetical protein B0J11DRAFT_95321 [Dendryphion nanum]
MAGLLAPIMRPSSRFPRREDAQTWKDRLIGKRIVSSDIHISGHDGWKTPDLAKWEPRVYYSAPVRGRSGEEERGFELQPNSPFLRLPAEIRNNILEFVLPPQILSQETEVESTEEGDVIWMNTSAFIFCCKQLYAEGRQLALERHTFEFEKFPRKVRLCSANKEEFPYIWNL